MEIWHCTSWGLWEKVKNVITINDDPHSKCVPCYIDCNLDKNFPLAKTPTVETQTQETVTKKIETRVVEENKYDSKIAWVDPKTLDDQAWGFTKIKSLIFFD